MTLKRVLLVLALLLATLAALNFRGEDGIPEIAPPFAAKPAETRGSWPATSSTQMWRPATSPGSSVPGTATRVVCTV